MSHTADMTGRAVAMGAVIALVIVYALGSGALVSTGSEWYAALDKPWWQPPPWFVGVIWPYNFVVIGIVGSVIAWQGAPARVVSFIVILGVTVSLAIGWAYLFFSPHELIWAAIALTAAAVLTVPLLGMAFAQEWWLGVLLLPYQAWVLIAASLSWGYVVQAGA